MGHPKRFVSKNRFPITNRSFKVFMFSGHYLPWKQLIFIGVFVVISVYIHSYIQVIRYGHV